jgi:PHD/YefM family antitoxin component YafN of YafNO toxin-antitoxin module
MGETRPLAEGRSADDFDSLVETLDILSNPELVQDIRDGLEDARDGSVVGHEQILADLANRPATRR